jgi:hypothetical protein
LLVSFVDIDLILKASHQSKKEVMSNFVIWSIFLFMDDHLKLLVNFWYFKTVRFFFVHGLG